MELQWKNFLCSWGASSWPSVILPPSPPALCLLFLRRQLVETPLPSLSGAERDSARRLLLHPHCHPQLGLLPRGSPELAPINSTCEALLKVPSRPQPSREGKGT